MASACTHTRFPLLRQCTPHANHGHVKVYRWCDLSLRDCTRIVYLAARFCPPRKPPLQVAPKTIRHDKLEPDAA
ncbi:MAG: hypothetical protein LW697_09880, partial [Blastopirellula sp.]|nr:hypothetical protein [Blastopirellula sp.]